MAHNLTRRDTRFVSQCKVIVVVAVVVDVVVDVDVDVVVDFVVGNGVVKAFMDVAVDAFLWVFNFFFSTKI